jgi:CIC family chloride channel protein
MGAMLGAAFGHVAHAALPGIAAPAGAYALVGMGAVFAGATRAPITGVLIIFELTGDYSIILPLMVAVVVATALSQRLSPDTIYTLKLRRRGIAIDRPRVASVMRTVTVERAMGAPPDAEHPTPELRAGDTLEHAVRVLARTDGDGVPVLSADGEAVVGWLTHRDVLRAYHDERERLSAARPAG